MLVLHAAEADARVSLSLNRALPCMRTCRYVLVFALSLVAGGAIGLLTQAWRHTSTTSQAHVVNLYTSCVYMFLCY